MAKFGGFAKAFFKHVIRDAVASVIIAAVVVIATEIVGMLLYTGIRIIMPSILALVILNTALAFVGAGFGMKLACKIARDDGKCFLCKKKDGKDASEYLDPSNQTRYNGAKQAAPSFTELCVLQLIVCLLFAVSGAVFILIKSSWLSGVIFQDIDAALKDNTVMITVWLGVESVIVSQIFYFIFTCIGYKEFVCKKCKRAFFIERKILDEKVYEKQGYVDKASRENIGSIGDIQVYADVTRRHNYTSRRKVTYYHYKCHYCGNEGGEYSHKLL